jgi:HEAT repeat protein
VAAVRPRSWLAYLALLLGAAASAQAAGDEVTQAAARLGSPTVAVRVAAAGELARTGRVPARMRAVRALERALFDAAPPVRRAALAALVDLDARSAAGSVARLLGVERDVSVLPAALLALGALHAEGQEGLVVRYAAHPAPAVRAGALAAAGRLGGPAMRRLVLNALQMAGPEDDGWLVRASALLALARVGRPDDLDLVQRVYEEGGRSSWLVRSAVAKVLAALHPHPRAPLEALLGDPDPRVAVSAAAGLAHAGLGDVLLGHLLDRRPSVRAAAVGGVRRGDLRRALPRLRRMARTDSSRAVRWAAAGVLFDWHDPLGDDLMLDAVRSREPALWTEAVARLARRTGASHGRDVEAWRRALEAARRAGR